MIIQAYTVILMGLMAISIAQVADSPLLLTRYTIGAIIWTPVIGRVFGWW